MDSSHSRLPGKPVLTLYYREGCHLCEDMEQQLYELTDTDSYQLEKIDIDENAQLAAIYNVRVPVLVADGVDLCQHFLDLQAVLNALQQPDASYNSDCPVS